MIIKYQKNYMELLCVFGLLIYNLMRENVLTFNKFMYIIIVY